MDFCLSSTLNWSLDLWVRPFHFSSPVSAPYHPPFSSSEGLCFLGPWTLSQTLDPTQKWFVQSYVSNHKSMDISPIKVSSHEGKMSKAGVAGCKMRQDSHMTTLHQSV